MIEVRVYSNRITIKGHAGSAEAGKDLVCAAASILFYTLVEAFDELERKGLLKANVKALNGDTEIALSIHPNGEEEAKKVLHFGEIGYRILADNYPQYIKIWDA